jgi:hypothetical protein
MNEEELLEYARINYPPGTRIQSIVNGSHYTVEDRLFFRVCHQNNTYIESNNCTVYKNGKWSEIISLPESYVESQIQCEIW